MLCCEQFSIQIIREAGKLLIPQLSTRELRAAGEDKKHRAPPTQCLAVATKVDTDLG